MKKKVHKDCINKTYNYKVNNKNDYSFERRNSSHPYIIYCIHHEASFFFNHPPFLSKWMLNRMHSQADAIPKTVYQLQVKMERIVRVFGNIVSTASANAIAVQ